VRELPAAGAVDLDAVDFPRHGDGVRTTVAQMLDATDTDAFLVLHRGAVVAEHYRHGMTAATPHILMSVSKSLTGIVAGRLEADGVLDVQREVGHYLPETAGSAFEGATVRQLLDMRAGVRFDEDYVAGGGPFIEYRVAMGWNPPAPGAAASDLRGFLAGMRERDGPHGGRLHYISPCSDLLGWVIERAAGRRFSDLLSELVWVPAGAGADACVTVDRLGAPRAAGGICTTARDLARLGQALVEGGAGVVSAAWLTDTRSGGDRAAWEAGGFAGSMSERPLRYRNQWYAMGEGDDVPLFGSGIHGQYLWVDPRADMVVVKFSSQPEPEYDVKDRLSLDGFWALGEALAGR
jgi:CubicO group peptidase (beta-lactamase class C family)